MSASPPPDRQLDRQLDRCKPAGAPTRRPAWPGASSGPGRPLLALLALASGCAGWRPVELPAEGPPFQAPAAWSLGGAPAGQAGVGLAHWWRRFNDAQLEQLVARALRANTSIGAAP
ncbi:hypothetical protein HSX11_15835, partial [Oxalobacteraceae bacterium]|nr:hypothetical protein [Oxalobacteraceae bacterium]